MVHLHYSPYQLGSTTPFYGTEVGAKKIMKVQERAVKKATDKAKKIPTTMTREEAHALINSPNAFISPNSADGMRTIRAVFGNIC
jgi:hypothetical protein